jgi:synaptobrevin family protein YKT6
VELCAERELSSYSRFTRGSISEFMTMFSKTVAERTKQGQRQDIQEQGNVSGRPTSDPPPPEPG